MPSMNALYLLRLVPLVLLPLAAWAQPMPAPLHYAVYFGGLHVVELDAKIAITPQTYQMQLSFQLVGVVGAVVHGSGSSAVAGRFRGATAVPSELVSNGQFRGRPRAMRMIWRDGDPVVTQMDPPDEEEREPVPVAEQSHTVDSLSATAALLRLVAATGRCDSTTRTFDGRRLAELAAHTLGEESLAATSRSSFSGPALRCDFEGRQIAGFARDADQAEIRRVQHGSAWFARLAPGTAPVPVRITFDARSFGEATVYLAGPP